MKTNDERPGDFRRGNDERQQQQDLQRVGQGSFL
jgi:hypothetical protein